MKTTPTLLAAAGVVVGFVNFFAFFVISTRLGGDALNGYERDGHYYVSSQGRATEVSEIQWRLSRLHAISIWITHPLAMAAMAYLLFNHVFPSMMYRATNRELAEAEQAVRRSGTPLASICCGGRIGNGNMNYRGPLVHAEVYPGGILVKPIFQAPFALATSDIASVHFKPEWWDKGVEIAHTSPQVTSPIFLRCSGDDPFMTALRKITSTRAEPDGP